MAEPLVPVAMFQYGYSDPFASSDWASAAITAAGPSQLWESTTSNLLQGVRDRSTATNSSDLRTEAATEGAICCQ